MPRKTRWAAAPAPSKGGAALGILTYAAVGIAGAALGSGGTYLALRPALAQAAQSRSVIAQAPNQASGAQADRLQGNQEEDQGQWAQAIASYQKAIAEGIDNPDIRTDLGVAYFKSSQPQKALEQYALAQRQDPNHENSLYNEGGAYAALGDSSRAIAVWHAYLQKFPSGQHIAGAKKLIAEVQAHGLTPAVPGKAQ